jgi:glycerophosphoryl diester phosphodiesterase
MADWAKNVFNNWDKVKGGRVSKEDLKNVLMILDQSLSDAEAEAICGAAGKRGGEVDISEWIRCIFHRSETRDDKVRARVRDMDTDGDGLLDKRELAEIFPETEIDEVLKTFNLQLKNGKVRVETFLALDRALEIAKKLLSVVKKGKDGLPRPLVMAHRGACGYNPPHSLEGYLDAINMGADYIEFDVISTKDHHLVMNHDITLEGETDVASKFPEMKTTENAWCIDSEPIVMTGYFAKDLTLAQVKTLEKIETWAFRTVGAARADKLVQRPLAAIEAAQALEKKRTSGSRNFGIIVEMKRPTWHRDVLKLPLEDKVIEALSHFKGPVNIQCFEGEPLATMRLKRPDWTYTRLLTHRAAMERGFGGPGLGAPVHEAVPEDEAEFPSFFGKIAQYAEWVSPWKGNIVPDPANAPSKSRLVEVCHGLGLEVNCYTFRSDVKFKHAWYGGNSSQEFIQFFNLGLDAVFTDFSDHGKHARDLWYLMKEESSTAQAVLTDVKKVPGMADTVSKNIRGFKKDGLPRPLVMAHRGASGVNPPHSLEGYIDAVNMGADYIEFDVICTKDHQLIMNHDITLGGETDVASKFPAKKTTENAWNLDGEPVEMTGYFAKDLTLLEVKTLEKIETWNCRSVGAAKAKRLVQRPQTVTEGATKMEELRVQGGRNFGLIVEVKRPKWHREVLKLPIEEKLIEALAPFKGPIAIQCFEPEPLSRLRALKPDWTYTRLLTTRERLAAQGTDVNEGVPEDPTQFREFFGKIAKYADFVSPWKGNIVPDPDRPPQRSALIDVCHELGLEVNCYTFRTDVQFLHQAYGGNATEEFALFFKLGVDSVFTDFSDHGVHARNVWKMLMKESDHAKALLNLPNPVMTTSGKRVLSLQAENELQVVANDDEREK